MNFNWPILTAQVEKQEKSLGRPAAYDIRLRGWEN
jgi:hypothetical protein